MAAGNGQRLGAAIPKAFVALAGEPLLVHALRGLRAGPWLEPLVVAVPLAQVSVATQLLAPYDVVVIPGGESRSASVALAVATLPAQTEHVLVHDAARALTPSEVVRRVLDALAAGADAVIPVIELSDTVKRVDATASVVATIDRADLRAAQTPQGFTVSLWKRAHAAHAAGADRHLVTDDAGLVERLGVPVITVRGHPDALKITQPLDLLVAEAVLRGR